VSGSITRSQIWKADGTEDQILYGSDTEADDKFGSTVSVDGNYAVIGADNEDAGGSNAGAVYIFYKSGGTWAQQAKLVADNAGAGDKFGRSVSISGDYVVVSAPFEDTTATDSGSVYIFKRSGTTWSQQQQIQAGDAADSDFLGSGIGQGGGGIAIDNDYFIIGAVNNDDGGSNTGSAYIFKRNTGSETWSEQSKLVASDPDASDQFGQTVAISGGYVAIGASLEDTTASNAGSVYIFKYDATYPPDDLPPVDSVGTGFNYKRYTALDTSTHYVYKMWRNSASDWRTPSPASANTIKVLKTDSTDWSDNDTTDTNPTYIDTTTYSGKVSLGQSGPTENYRFSVPIFGSWSQQAKIQASDAEADDYFGSSVSLSGDYLAVGARTEDTGGSQAGSVYIFKKASGSETWSQEAKLQASDVSAASQFGMSVSLSGTTLAVGANAEDTAASDAGAAYIFERSGTTWTEVKKITASDAAASDYFGESISTDGITTFVGAFGEDTKGSAAGAAYVYEKVYVGPTLTYDNSNKLSLTGVTTPSSNLTFGSVTTDIGSAKDVYIKDQGTYTFHTNDGDQALIMNKTVSSDP
jgi:hypothetical protein